MNAAATLRTPNGACRPAKTTRPAATAARVVRDDQRRQQQSAPRNSISQGVQRTRRRVGGRRRRRHGVRGRAVVAADVGSTGLNAPASSPAAVTAAAAVAIARDDHQEPQRRGRTRPSGATAAATVADHLPCALVGESQSVRGLVRALDTRTGANARPSRCSVQGGYVAAFDHLRQEDRTFSVHRVTGVADPEPEAGAAGHPPRPVPRRTPRERRA